MSAKDRVMLLEDPICEICREPMEPIPPVGWVCLNNLISHEWHSRLRERGEFGGHPADR